MYRIVVENFCNSINKVLLWGARGSHLHLELGSVCVCGGGGGGGAAGTELELCNRTSQGTSPSLATHSSVSADSGT